MVSVEVNVNSSVGNLANMPRDIIERGLDLTAQDLINNLMVNSPVDHGLLKQWAVTESDDLSRTIQSPAEYAAYQNYGTVPHWIEPVNAKALHWDGIFSKGHYVGGIEAKHFVEDSIDATMSRIQEFFTINGD
jgi:hypothetical protein